MVIRNEWIERATAAAAVHARVSPWIYDARRIVVQAGLDPTSLDELMKSTYMQDEVVDQAMAVLRKIAPEPSENERQASAPRGLSQRLTGKDAAKVIGVNESTISRWQGETPVWARGDEPLFKHLLERSDGRYQRERIIKLAAWFSSAMSSGCQEATPCP